MKRFGIALVCLAMLALIVAPAAAKKSDYIDRFDAVAASVQGGGSSGMAIVRFMINEWTTPEDRAEGIAAFNEGGAQALYDWLDKQPKRAVGFSPEGRPYDMMYAFQWEKDGNRTIILATNRPISGLETMVGTQRSLRYNISLVLIEFEAGKKKGKGQMILGAELTINKEGQLSIEAAALQPIQFTKVTDKMK
jgi:hypothetical protein